MKSMVKEIAILVAMMILIVLILGITFYDYIPTYKVAPEVQKYVADSNIKEALEEIEEEEVDSIIIKPLTIDSSNLDLYRAKKSYEKGKANPFADYSKLEQTTQEAEDAQASSSQSSETTSSSSSSQNTTSSSGSTSSNNTTSSSSSNQNATSSSSTEQASSSEGGGKFFNTAGTK